jgi:hypothetical protein
MDVRRRRLGDISVEAKGEGMKNPETAGTQKRRDKRRDSDFTMPALDERRWLKYKFVPTERLRQWGQSPVQVCACRCAGKMKKKCQ